MFEILGQTDLPSVPSDTLKWTLIIVIALVLLGMAIAAFIRGFAKPVKTRLNDDPPISVRKAAPRFNFALAENRHADLDRRVTALEDWQASFVKQTQDDKEDLLEAGRLRGVEINDHVEDVRRELSDKIDAMPGQIIATLKNTGAI